MKKTPKISMPPTKGANPTTVKKARTASIVIFATAIIWVGGQSIAGRLGVPGRYAFLLDLAALAGLLWAMIVLFQVWRDIKKDRDA